jgi:hypothetical protein
MSIGRDLDGAVPRKHLDDNGTAQVAQVAPQIQVLYYTDRPGPNASIVLRADFSFTLFLLQGPEHNYEMRASGNSRFHRVSLPSRIADNMLWVVETHRPRPELTTNGSPKKSSTSQRLKL